MKGNKSQKTLKIAIKKVKAEGTCLIHFDSFQFLLSLKNAFKTIEPKYGLLLLLFPPKKQHFITKTSCLLLLTHRKKRFPRGNPLTNRQTMHLEQSGKSKGCHLLSVINGLMNINTSQKLIKTDTV